MEKRRAWTTHREPAGRRPCRDAVARRSSRSTLVVALLSEIHPCWAVDGHRERCVPVAGRGPRRPHVGPAVEAWPSGVRLCRMQLLVERFPMGTPAPSASPPPPPPPPSPPPLTPPPSSCSSQPSSRADHLAVTLAVQRKAPDNPRPRLFRLVPEAVAGSSDRPQLNETQQYLHTC